METGCSFLGSEQGTVDGSQRYSRKRARDTEIAHDNGPEESLSVSRYGSSAQFSVETERASNNRMCHVIGKSNFKRLVLEEHEYVRRLGAIIRRCFFPDAPDDFIEESAQALAQSRRPSSGNFVRQVDSQGRLVPVSDSSLNVDGFQRYYTSEDNASFEDLQSKAISQTRERQKRMHVYIRDRESKEPLSSMLLGMGPSDATKSDQATSGNASHKDVRSRQKVIAHSKTRLSEEALLANSGYRSTASVVTEVTRAENEVNDSFLLDPSIERQLDRRYFKLAKRTLRDELGYQLAQKAGSNIKKRSSSSSYSAASSVRTARTTSSGKTKLSDAGAALAKRLLSKR